MSSFESSGEKNLKIILKIYFKFLPQTKTALEKQKFKIILILKLFLK